MESKGFLLCLLSSFMVAILPLIFLSNSNSKLPTHRSLLSSRNSTLSLPHPLQSIPSVTSSVRVWPDLVFNWRSVLATIIGFLGSAFGTVGGVGGGGIFVPMLNLIVGFDTKSAAALSKCMIMGASTSSVWYNLRVPHPSKNVPIIDYDLALIFQPMLMLGITIGVALSVVFPYWLITVLIIILFLGTSSRSFFKGIEMWKEETVMKMEIEKREAQSNANSQVIIDAGYEPLIPKEEKSGLEILLFNIRWKRTLVLVVVWVAFLLLQIFKNNTAVCSPLYWVLNILQFPVSLSVFGYGALKLYRESKKRRMCGNTETVCEATISWTGFQLLFCALCGILGGTVGGLLGSGGGFILGPLLLEIGVIPQVASATATFVMMFSSSLSVVEFYFLKRFPIPYALYLIAVSVLAGFWGQCLIRKLVTWLRRASIIVFILSAVIFASALTMGVVGVGTSLSMIHKHEYMGFLSFCEE
ncbi:sulfite exporter TauE/SafE family protein 4 isoform X1 [Magnolia sinica]|uniref:sulfite exporter TauE/SafE family protein 4 isoform X1 n=1 Tax=Magnolia sinica TaxID=86752 RepID=UPI0026590A74|nr:sulfite exporter TauE/SafE family protein 4 isoform X1 [Magnolia sinica]